MYTRKVKISISVPTSSPVKNCFHPQKLEGQNALLESMQNQTSWHNTWNLEIPHPARNYFEARFDQKRQNKEGERNSTSYSSFGRLSIIPFSKSIWPPIYKEKVPLPLSQRMTMGQMAFVECEVDPYSNVPYESALFLSASRGSRVSLNKDWG